MVFVYSLLGYFCPFLFMTYLLFVGRLSSDSFYDEFEPLTSFSLVCDYQIIHCACSWSWSLWIRLIPKFTVVVCPSHPLIVFPHLNNRNSLLHFMTVFQRWYKGYVLQQILVWCLMLHFTIERLFWMMATWNKTGPAGGKEEGLNIKEC